MITRRPAFSGLTRSGARRIAGRTSAQRQIIGTDWGCGNQGSILFATVQSAPISFFSSAS
jgi:hypothetical protein